MKPVDSIFKEHPLTMDNPTHLFRSQLWFPFSTFIHISVLSLTRLSFVLNSFYILIDLHRCSHQHNVHQTKFNILLAIILQSQVKQRMQNISLHLILKYPFSIYISILDILSSTSSSGKRFNDIANRAQDATKIDSNEKRNTNTILAQLRDE